MRFDRVIKRHATWRGTIDRRTYAAVGAALIAVKYGLDRALAAAFGRTWSYVDYWSPSAYAVDELPAGERGFFVALLALAIPFALVGLSLTIRRLRDAGLPLALVALFFVPVVNLVFFVVLSLAPPRAAGGPERPPAVRASRALPRSRFASALAGIVLTALLGVALAALATEGLENYGWGLFVGLPFCLGLLSVLVYGHDEPRSASSCVWVGVLAAALSSVGLLLTGLEGAICLVMALPLSAPLAALGALTGYAIQRRDTRPFDTRPTLCGVALALPLLMGVEDGADRRPVAAPVTSSVVIDAPPEVVWRHVVSFSELPAAREAIFRTGIAYPIEARMEGRGVGAVRRCRFSTGDFVEPITVWDEPRLLRFSVRSQPPPMRELSPLGDVHPPHLDGFLRSRQGQFRLIRLRGGRTLLRGTTWYENRMWPAAYWRGWSDELIHRIHLRVLRHVEDLSERSVGARAPGNG